MNNGTVQAIWIKRMKRGPMDTVDSATLVAGRGLRGNANQGGRRQVTIIAQERWQELMEQLNADISPSSRRANLMVKGIVLENSRGCVLRVGTCRIRIFGETRPCERMDEAFEGLREAMKSNWGGGAFGVVLDDGEIHIGDAVSWEEE
jgi:MOSC domain-containing protein YiiM